MVDYILATQPENVKPFAGALFGNRSCGQRGAQ
jgi:hypothetical protein